MIIKYGNNNIILKMSSKAPRVYLGTISVINNFFGLKTVQTAVYGAAECMIKVSPVLLVAYGAAKATSAPQSSDQYLDEEKDLK